jgi:hypothetical protein
VDLTQEEIILAFSRAATESKFFPAPATLHEFSGHDQYRKSQIRASHEILARFTAAYREG